MKAILLSALMIALPAAAHAAVAIVDVDNSSGSTKRISSSFGQTFTPTVSGCLTGIRLNVAAGSGFRVTVWAMDPSGTELGTMLGSQSFKSASALPTYSWAEVTFATGIPQIAGTQLAFTVVADSGFTPAISDRSGYSGGAFFEYSGNPEVTPMEIDLVFQTLVSPVPEPGVAWFAACTACAGFAVRRR